MPLLNPPDILPEAMRFILRTLIGSPSQRCAQDALFGLVAPQGLAEATRALGTVAADDDDDYEDGPEDLSVAGTQIVRCSLAALKTMNFVTIEKDEVATGERALHWRRPDDVTASSFAGALRSAVLDATRGALQADCGDLIGAVALMTAASEPFAPSTPSTM